MSDRPNRRTFASRPGDPEQWIRSADAAPREGMPSRFTARLTIDITPELRGRIKIAAFQRGVTVADMLRELFEREFPKREGDSS
ncbi:MAG: hypothetical protein CMH69_18835 [Nitratireductor sp.]|nr:hypothetical protein [Nitratireductor sp.]